MPTIEENLTAWTDYDWSRQGDEWSVNWSSTEYLWWGMLYPRLMGFLPAGTTLEIAPGFGRITRFLRDVSERLIVVDLAARCIEACRERFHDASNIEYHVNDGMSLEMIDDSSIDFAFSYDSLVHAEADVMRGYIQQLGRKLKPTGIGFIHHSNLGAFVDPETGELPFPPPPHWRAASMSARLFHQFCEEADVQCLRQEAINTGGEVLLDCFSLFARAGSPHACPHSIWENNDFRAQALALGSVARHYRPVSESCAEPASGE